MRVPGASAARPFRLTAPVTPEDDIHVSLANALNILLPPEAVWTTWEARNVGPVEGARRRARGVAAGWPDLGVFYDARATLIELKRGRDWQLSTSQKVLHPRLALAGFRVYVCHDVEQVLVLLSKRGIPLRGRITG